MYKKYDDDMVEEGRQAAEDDKHRWYEELAAEEEAEAQREAEAQAEYEAEVAAQEVEETEIDTAHKGQ